MFTEASNTKKQGDMGLGAAIAFFTAKGWSVSIPLTDSQDYDLIVDDPTKGLQRISIKTTSCYRHGSFIVGLRVCGGNSKRNYVHKLATEVKYAMLFMLTSAGDIYYMPKPNVTGGIALGKKYQCFKVKTAQSKFDSCPAHQ